jgi:hypothetical protein
MFFIFYFFKEKNGLRFFAAAAVFGPADEVIVSA